MKVWIASTGSYSDYTVEGVFSSEEKAFQYMAAHIEDGPGIWNSPKEFELDSDSVPIEGYEVGDLHCVVINFESGEISDDSRYDPIRFLRHPEKCLVDQSNWGAWVYSPISIEHARQVAIETRRRYLNDNPEAAARVRKYEDGKRSQLLLEQFWNRTSQQLVPMGIIVRWAYSAPLNDCYLFVVESPSGSKLLVSWKDENHITLDDYQGKETPASSADEAFDLILELLEARPQ